LPALEELLRSGLLCEVVEESQAFDGFAFPREMIREVVYQEAGVTRQRLVQRRVSAVIREEIGDDRGEEARLPRPAPSDGHAETRHGQRRRVVARAVHGEMHRAVAQDASGATRRHADAGTSAQTLLVARERGAWGQAAPDVSRSTPGSPPRAFFEMH